MRRLSLFSVVFASISLSCFSQVKKELANDYHIVISYTVTKKEVKFFIKTNGGSPCIYIDVNKNQNIDEMLDVAYGLIGNQKMKLCPFFLIDERTFTYCGKLVSKAKLSGKEYDYVFTLPKKELTTALHPDKINVMISLVTTEGDKLFYRYYPSGSRIFENVYEINIE